MFTLRRRRILRRAVHTRCQAVAMRGFRLLGDRVLDLSPYGLLLAADDGAMRGEEVVVSFSVPGHRRAFDATARVARVIEGWREQDAGFALGLQFTAISLADRLRLADALRGTPPPVPRRAVHPSLRCAS